MGTGKRKFKFEILEPREMLAADPIITEFMASNGSTLEDGQGATSDWIEIYNNGDQSVDLAGYRLTDDATDTNKWLFPSHVLESGDYLVVFASGNNTLDSAGNFHTNFSLSASGEYLALVAPGGSVLSEFGLSGTDYPAQTSDISYGLAYNSTLTNVVTPSSSAKYVIPSNDAVDATWTDLVFDDSSWQMGTASLGYENSPADYAGLIQTALPMGTTSVYVRMPFTVSDTGTILGMLQMKYDDGFIAYINGTRVASQNAPEVGAHNSIATEDHPDGLAVEYVDFDISGYSSTLHVGANTLAIHMLNRNDSSDMLSVPNLQLVSGGLIEPQVIGTLGTPTPGLPNTNLRASDVQFSRVGGAFVSSFLLSLTSSGANESIRYTTDGSIPNAGSTLYTGAFTVNSTVQVRARAFGSVGQVGIIKTETFSRASPSVGSFSSDLPVLVIENFGQGVPDRNFQDASLALYDVDPMTGRSSLANSADLTTAIGQHRRGSSTFGNPKTNLRIELRDDLGEDQSIPLLGLPAESDWILFAPYIFDRAMVRNSVLYDLSRQAGNYAPRTRFVEVYSNTNDGVLSDNDYMGVYVLMEKIKRDDNRVDIDELTVSQNSEPEITGGYILKIDRTDDTPDGSWQTSRGYPNRGGEFVHVEPDRTDMTLAQRDYIRGYVQEAEDALFGPNSTDPELGYQAYFDIDAAVDFHMFNVFAENPDAFRLSTYLTKDRGGKLAYGPIWDFDRAMAPDDDLRSANPLGWFDGDSDYYFVAEYWGKMFEDPNFEQRWVDRWQELRHTVFSDANLQATVDGYADELTEAQVRNFVKWAGVAPNSGPYADPGLSGWEGEVSHLANWLIVRANWIDTQMIAAPTFAPEPGNVDVNSPVTLWSPSAANTIYYTLDGSDPRADGGGIAAGAILYTTPIPVTQTTEITARAFGSGGMADWSQLVTGLYSVELPADASNLRITELQYHPANPTSEELAIVPGAEDDDFEFIELLNISDDTISLNGVALGGGISFDFSSGDVTTLAPGNSVVVVENREAFVVRYGDEMLIAGQYAGKLSNGGEQVTLKGSSGQGIHDFLYSDDSPWPTIADGSGPSLEVVDEFGDYSSASNWRASATSHGTPGIQTTNQPGDLDFDFDVDGADFLAWQRGYGTLFDSNDLDDVENHFSESIPVPVSAQQVALANSEESLLAPESDVLPVTLSDEPSVGSFAFFSLHSISPEGKSVLELEPAVLASVDYVFERVQSPTSHFALLERDVDENLISMKNVNQASNESLDTVFDGDLTIRLDI